MTSTDGEIARLSAQLSEHFGIAWDPGVMAYEEPHIFKRTTIAGEERRDAEYGPTQLAR